MTKLHETTKSKEPFALDFTDPFKTFKDGKPQAIPYIVDGLLTQGGFSILGAKPKQGKSSLSRYLATCVAKGVPFLGRQTVKGEVILVSLEDPQTHVDNSLKVLEYDSQKDARIRIVEKLAPSLDENITALDEALKKLPGTRLVIVDTLPKLLRLSDLDDYAPTMAAVEKLRELARKFPHLHIQAIAHLKKVRMDDVFDSLLGSTALRGEPDTSIAIYGEGSQRIIATETRIGRNIPPTLLTAKLVESAGAHVVKEFSLDVPFADWQAEQKDKGERKRKLSHEERIIAFLTQFDDGTTTQQAVLDEVEGKTSHLLAAIHRLIEKRVVSVTGTKHSATDPLKLCLNRDSLSMNDFINQHRGSEGEK